MKKRTTILDLMFMGALAALASLVVMLASGHAAPVLTMSARDGLNQAIPADHVFQDGERFWVSVSTAWPVGGSQLDLSWDPRLEWTTVGSATCKQAPGDLGVTCPAVDQWRGPDNVWVWFTYHAAPSNTAPMVVQATFGGSTQTLSLKVTPGQAPDHRVFLPAVKREGPQVPQRNDGPGPRP